MKAWIALTLFLFTGLFNTPAFTKSDKSSRQETPFQSIGDGPDFYIDYANYRGLGDSTYVEFYLQVGYNSLQFIRDIRRFLASYELSFKLKDTTGATINEYLTSDSFNVDTFGETENSGRARVMLVGLNLTSGPYKMQATLYENETNRQSVISQNITVRDYSSSSLAMSDIQLSQKITPTTQSGPFVKNQRYVEPNAVRIFTRTRPDLYVYFEIYNLTYSASPDSDNYFYTCDFILTRENGSEIARFDQVERIPGRTSAHSLKIPLGGLPDGKYALKVITTDEANFRKTENIQKFTFLGMPLALASPDEF